MSIKEQVVHELDRLSEIELRRVAGYVAYLQRRATLGGRSAADESRWAALYAEAAAEDRALAAEGMKEYEAGLSREDGL